MVYVAPSRIIGEKIGVDIHNCWYLAHHELLQQNLLPTGAVRDGYNESLVENILDQHRWTDQYLGFDRYHIAFGMISQFNRNDIEYFINTKYEDRSSSYHFSVKYLAEKIGVRGLGWIPSPQTLNIIRQNV